jgi:hypothetical protein
MPALQMTCAVSVERSRTLPIRQMASRLLAAVVARWTWRRALRRLSRLIRDIGFASEAIEAAHDDGWSEEDVRRYSRPRG